MEDLDALWDSELVEDLINVLEGGWSKDMLKMNITNLLGPEWKKVGAKILKGEDKSLTEKLNAIE
jgi:hypothetical protein